MLRFLGAAVAAMALSWTSSASAAVMLANLSGDWNDSPIWETWSVELLYDTSGLTLSEDGDYRSYSWNIADGTPSPLLAAKGTFIGHAYCDWGDDSCDLTPIPVSFDLTEFTSFRIDLDWAYAFSLTGGNVTLTHLGVFGDWSGTDIAAPFFGGWPDYGYGEIGDVSLGMPHTHALSVVAAAVPEPATWAMMIIGFGAVGSMVRASRRRNAFRAT